MKRRAFCAALATTPVVALAKPVEQAEPQAKLTAEGMWLATVSKTFYEPEPLRTVESIVGAIRAVGDTVALVRMAKLPPTLSHMPFLSASTLLTMPGSPGWYGDIAKLRVYNAGFVTWNRVFPAYHTKSTLVNRHTGIYSDSEPFYSEKLIKIACSNKKATLTIRPDMGPAKCPVWFTRHEGQCHPHDHTEVAYNKEVYAALGEWPLPAVVHIASDIQPGVVSDDVDVFRLTDTLDKQGRVVYRLSNVIKAG